MDDKFSRESYAAPRAESWLAAGASSAAAGIWLLQRGDPFLLTLWGTGLVIVGLVSVILGLGVLLRIWR